jgi:hypothetical protein
MEQLDHLDQQGHLDKQDSVDFKVCIIKSIMIRVEETTAHKACGNVGTTFRPYKLTEVVITQMCKIEVTLKIMHSHMQVLLVLLQLV